MALKVTSGFNQSGTKLFVDALISKGLIKPGFQQILSGRSLSEVEDYLLTKQLMTKDQLAKEYADFYGLPFVHIADKEISPVLSTILPLNIAEQFGVVAYEITGLDLYLAVGNPARLQQGAPKAITAIRQQKGLRIHLAVAPADEVKGALRRLHQTLDDKKPDPETKIEAHPESPDADSSHVRSLNKEDLINEIRPHNKFVDLKKLEISKSVIERIPLDVAKKYHIVIFDSQAPKSKLEPTQIKLASTTLDDAHTQEIISYIEQRNHVIVDQYSTDDESFRKALTFYGGDHVAPDKVSEDHKQPAEELDKTAPKSDSSVEVSAPASVTVPTSPVIPVPLPKSQIEPKITTGETERVNPGKLPFQEVNIADLAPVINGMPGVKQTSNQAEPAPKTGDEDLAQQIGQSVDSINDLVAVVKTGMVPQMLAAFLILAIKMRASDIHIEAERETVRIRFRIDGILHDVMRIPISFHAPLISRVKILAKLKIDEQRVPQDGRFDVSIAGRQVDLRISTMPTVFGEKVVIRLLDKSEGIKTLEQLGVTGMNFDILIKSIKKPYGIILSTGPTGSGKSTTLYAILSRISEPGVNIVTLEDPVEYELPGVNQAQVKPQIGFTFAEGLRAVLRQDPNIIMVGEIRDLETAAMSTQAALTGHLVLSTLHTNDAAGALPRLIDMGVEPYLITSSINCVIGQRLVRRICDNCRERVEVPVAVKDFIFKQLTNTPSDQLKNISLDQLVFYYGRGCEKCDNGYLGRTGIFEVLPMSAKIEEIAVKKAPASEINAQAINEGMITMMQDGLLKALKGITTVDEVLRVTTASILEAEGEGGLVV